MTPGWHFAPLALCFLGGISRSLTSISEGRFYKMEIKPFDIGRPVAGGSYSQNEQYLPNIYFFTQS